MLDDYGLLPALRWAGEQFVKRTGVAVRVDGSNPIAPAAAGSRLLSSVSLKRR